MTFILYYSAPGCRFKLVAEFYCKVGNPARRLGRRTLHVQVGGNRCTSSAAVIPARRALRNVRP